MADPVESGLQDVRAEWVPSDTSGAVARPPTDPEWNRFSDYVASYPGWSGDAGTEGQRAVGSGDIDEHFRGPEEHDLSIQWWMQRFFLDNSGNANDPIGELLNYEYGSEFPIHEVLLRRETTQGGALGGGYREFIYASGARPSGAELPGDPSASEPIIAEGQYAAEMVRQYVVHQPSSSITPQVKSTSTNDTTQTVTIESEGGSATDTFDLNGDTLVSGNSSTSFSDIDAIWVDGDHEGDIVVEDGSGNDVLEDPIPGTNTDGVDAYRGIPLLGAGSHASSIGTDPADYLFLGTDATYDGGALAESTSADRVHTLDLSIEVDLGREPRQATRRQAIDIGPRTVSAETDLAGPYETAKQNYNYFTGKAADLVYTFPDGTITVQNAQPADTDDVDYEASDTNLIYGVTLEGHAGSGSTAVTASHT